MIVTVIHEVRWLPNDVAEKLDQLASSISQTLTAINNLNRKVDEFMATQEERLQAILVAVKNVKQMLADLKVSNPAIEDEITAIEEELAPATDTGTSDTGTGGAPA